MNSLSTGTFAGTVFFILIALIPSSVRASSAIGPRAGYDFDSGNFILGAEAELGRAFQNIRFAPSLDFELGDNSIVRLQTKWTLVIRI